VSSGLELVRTHKGRISEATTYCGGRPWNSCPLGDRTLPGAGGTRGRCSVRWPAISRKAQGGSHLRGDRVLRRAALGTPVRSEIGPYQALAEIAEMSDTPRKLAPPAAHETRLSGRATLIMRQDRTFCADGVLGVVRPREPSGYCANRQKEGRPNAELASVFTAMRLVRNGGDLGPNFSERGSFFGNVFHALTISRRRQKRSPRLGDNQPLFGRRAEDRRNLDLVEVVMPTKAA
jgi:hypothetical protein